MKTYQPGTFFIFINKYYRYKLAAPMIPDS